LATPAAAAISSIGVAAKPLSPNSEVAAATMESRVASRRSACFAMFASLNIDKQTVGR
jgi:hypothetical protein